jgi:hypothetical protein
MRTISARHLRRDWSNLPDAEFAMEIDARRTQEEIAVAVKKAAQ